jgi:hypothetical protein
MSKSPESEGSVPIPLIGIYLDVPSKTVVFAAEEGVLAAVRLTAQGIVFQYGESHEGQSEGPSPPLPSPSERLASSAETEREKPLTLQGKLKGAPRLGRPDAKGNKTTWARFAAHEAEREGVHLYSATFHRHTADIALGLESGASLTLQGYPHEQSDPASKRMDTLSVINVLDYPGKPEK